MADREVDTRARPALRPVPAHASAGRGAAEEAGERTEREPRATAERLVLPSERRRRLEHFAATFGPLPGEPDPRLETPADLPAASPRDEPSFEAAATPPDAGPAAGVAAASRRTVEITGRPGPDPSSRPRRRRPRPARNGPDRLALWAVVMGVLLALVAATTARGDEAPAPPAASVADAVR